MKHSSGSARSVSPAFRGSVLIIMPRMGLNKINKHALAFVLRTTYLRIEKPLTLIFFYAFRPLG